MVNTKSSSPKEQMDIIIKNYLASNPIARMDGKVNELEVRFGTNSRKHKPFTKIDYDNVVKKLYAQGFTCNDVNGLHSLRIFHEYTDKNSGTKRMSNIRTEINGIDLIQEYCKTNNIQHLLDLPSTTYDKIIFNENYKYTNIYEDLSSSSNNDLRKKVETVAMQQGMVFLPDTSGTNIDVQIFDTAKIDLKKSAFPTAQINGEKPVLIVMDYAFGEQAYETIDELLKPYKKGKEKSFINVVSVSIMGKAGILEGGKGDIMIPCAHINEGTADNYPFENELTAEMFDGNDMPVFAGPMVTVLGTSLQNRDLLKFFHESTWKAIGLEMEGAYYQKAIQSASKIRKSINPNVKVRYAYYASDNPLETGSTLASGGLGTTGVKPTYLITIKILEQIFNLK